MIPEQGGATNRRPAGQSDGSDNVAATAAAVRAFPAVGAELGRVCRACEATTMWESSARVNPEPKQKGERKGCRCDVEYLKEKPPRPRRAQRLSLSPSRHPDDRVE
jgi:hypothetical protein